MDSVLGVVIVFLLLEMVGSFQLFQGMQNWYAYDEEIPVKVRKLHSFKNLPYDFYHLPFCAPEGVSEGSPNEAETIGELFFGDRIKRSVFEFNMMKEVKCRVIPKELCPGKFTKEEVEALQAGIDEDYLAQLIVDNIPVASIDYGDICRYRPLPSGGTGLENTFRAPDGYSIGCVSVSEQRFVLNNHFSFNIKINTREDGTASVISVEIVPASMKHDTASCNPTQGISAKLPLLEVKDDMDLVTWSYSVSFEEVEQKWSSRWDNYAQSEQSSIHWYSIINSCLIVLFLTGIIAMIMIRILRKDISEYNVDEPDVDEKGWKLVHSEVFRPPYVKSLFAVLLGTGIQIFGTCLVSLPLGAVGIFSPSMRGYFVSALVILFFLMGLPAGFFGLRLYKTFEGKRWKLTTLLLGILLPTMVFIVFSIFSLVVEIGASSTITIPFLNAVLLFLLWVGIYVPLCFIGGFVGWRRKPIEFPCETSRIPRRIPSQPLYLKSFITIALGGILPFGAIFVELYFVMTSIWMNKLYFFFGFVFLIFVILLVVTSEITIVLTYLQLCAENYKWWWRSFFTGGFAALYMFGFAVYYFFTLQTKNWFLGIVYFGYMGLASLMMSVFLGTVGFVATMFFVRRIYSSIKID